MIAGHAKKLGSTRCSVWCERSDSECTDGNQIMSSFHLAELISQINLKEKEYRERNLKIFERKLKHRLKGQCIRKESIKTTIFQRDSQNEENMQPSSSKVCQGQQASNAASECHSVGGSQKMADPCLPTLHSSRSDIPVLRQPAPAEPGSRPSRSTAGSTAPARNRLRSHKNSAVKNRANVDGGDCVSTDTTNLNGTTMFRIGTRTDSESNKRLRKCGDAATSEGGIRRETMSGDSDSGIDRGYLGSGTRHGREERTRHRSAQTSVAACPTLTSNSVSCQSSAGPEDIEVKAAGPQPCRSRAVDRRSPTVSVKVRSGGLHGGCPGTTQQVLCQKEHLRLTRWKYQVAERERVKEFRTIQKWKNEFDKLQKESSMLRQKGNNDYSTDISHYVACNAGAYDDYAEKVLKMFEAKKLQNPVTNIQHPEEDQFLD